ncbi:MAG: hypothetical protein VXZ55_03395, partial [Planctomycetota bacterium]|nr:hypothetical protein [Planctomycetota bacterium]
MTLSYDGANLRVLWIPAGTVDEWEASQSDRSQIAVRSQSDRREFAMNSTRREALPRHPMIRGKAATHCSATLLGNIARQRNGDDSL